MYSRVFKLIYYAFIHQLFPHVVIALIHLTTAIADSSQTTASKTYHFFNAYVNICFKKQKWQFLNHILSTISLSKKIYLVRHLIK